MVLPSLRRFFPGFLGLLLGSVSCYPVYALDLLEAYQAARENDPVFSEAQAKFEASKQKVKQGRAGLLPSLTLSGNTYKNDEEIRVRDPHRTNDYDYNSKGYTLTLTQPLFRWQNIATYDQTKAIYAQSEAAFADAKQDLILRVARAYFDVLSARENFQAVETLRLAVDERLKLATDAYDLGTGVVTDVHEAQSRYELVVAQEAAAKTQLLLSERALEMITGLWPANAANLIANPSLRPPQPDDADQWLSAAVQGNPGIKQRQFAVLVADHELAIQRAGHYPTLDLVASTGHTSGLNSGIDEDIDLNRIGLELRVPIFQGGGVTAKRREAAANKTAAEAAVDAARRTTKVAIFEAYLGVTSGLAQVKALEAGLKASHQSLESNKDAFKTGIRLTVDVLNAENQLFDARRDLIKARLDTLYSQLKLKALTGALDEEELVIINALMER